MVGPLSVSDIVSVSVSVAEGAVASKAFNQGLIVGPSTVIPSYGANPVLRQYPSTDAMLTDGFTNDDPEFIAAELYFSAQSGPTFVWIGRQDLTAILTIIPHSGSAGTLWVVGEHFSIAQVSASNAIGTVLSVTAGAVVTCAVTIGNQGTAYSVATGLTATSLDGNGIGLEVDITAVGQSYLQAVETCALASQAFYGFMCCNATDADHLALGAYSTANWQTLLYFGSSNDAAIPSGLAGNVALQMKAAKYRALLSYNTDQNGAFPNNLYAAAAILGEYCGLNTGLAGSAFTLDLKAIEGIAPELLTQSQWQAINSANCNSCASFGPYTGYLTLGILSSGEFFDQILFRAMLVNQIQTNLMNLLVSVPKVPQTNPGEQQLIAQVDTACANMASIGYIGPGVWKGAGVLKLATGQTLPLGYINQADSYANQSSGDRAARKAMPIYSSIIEAGAVHSVQVNVNIQQ